MDKELVKLSLEILGIVISVLVFNDNYNYPLMTIRNAH